MCQCPDRTCLHFVLSLLGSWNSVLVNLDLCSEHKERRRFPLLLALPIPCLPRTDRHPRVVVTANSSIKVTHDDCFAACTDGVQYIRQLLIESILCCYGMLHCWCIYALMRCRPKYYRFLPIDNRSDIMRSECPIGNSDLIALRSDKGRRTQELTAALPVGCGTWRTSTAATDRLMVSPHTMRSCVGN